MLYSAEIEVTDNRLPNASFVEQRPQVQPCPLNLMPPASGLAVYVHLCPYSSIVGQRT